MCQCRINLYRNFNPRSREGSDFLKLCHFHRNKISIHAPARGATLYGSYRFCPLLFQSTLPRGERQRALVNGYFASKFQSTLPRGERPSLCILCAVWVDFNPRSREGSDVQGQNTSTVLYISIHAPARGATMSRT